MPKIPQVETSNSREVLYPEVSINHYTFPTEDSDNELLTQEDAIVLLGCAYPTEEQGRFDKYHYIDILGRTVFCGNWDLQRPYMKPLSMAIMYDILNGFFEDNLETIIVGRTGLVLDGKHRLIALIDAVNEYRRNPEQYPFWDNDPAIPSLVALGASEEAKVVNTIGTGKSRSLSDSLYASGVFDSTLTAKQLRQVSKTTEFCIRFLWQRTGAMNDAYSPRIRHAEAFDFLSRHNNIHHCVKTIIEENKGKLRRIEKFISLGTASGLLYLMATKEKGTKEYREMAIPDEGVLDFDNIEKAETYWLNLADSAKETKEVANAIAAMFAVGNSSAEERIAILVKGWNAYAEKGHVLKSDLKLKVDIDDENRRHLSESPAVANSVDWVPPVV